MSEWRRYADLQIGESFPRTPFPYSVTEETVFMFHALIRHSRKTSANSSVDLASVPPMLAAVYIRGAQNALKGPPGGVHAKQRFKFLREIHIGDTLETTLTIKDKYEKKGRNYIVCETRTRNQDGVDVTVGEIVSIWGQEP